MNSVCMMPLLNATLLSSSVPLSEPLTHSAHCCEHSRPKHTTIQISILQVITTNAVLNMFLSFTFMLGKPVGVKYGTAGFIGQVCVQFQQFQPNGFLKWLRHMYLCSHSQCSNLCSIFNHQMKMVLGTSYAYYPLIYSLSGVSCSAFNFLPTFYGLFCITSQEHFTYSYLG